MRPCVLSAALLSLLVDGSYAFAPPKSTASPTASHLAAGNELSGMLSDYSSSAAAEVTSATAEKVAVAVSSAVTTPSPPAAPSLATFIKNEVSVIDAARVAQDAADQAAAAAAAVATKGAAATKAAATVGAGGISLKATVGGAAKLPFQVDPSKANAESSFDALAKSKENLATMKANILGGVVPKGSTGNLDISLPKFDSASVTPAITDIINSLHLKDYGGWYVAAAAAIFASLQRSAGVEEASAKFESELVRARKKASEAATAAGLAAEGATTAKKLALKMEKDINTDGIGALLESSRSKKVQMEKDMMQKDMLALQAEVSSLRSELATYKGGKKKKAAANTKTVKTEIELAYPTKVVMETDPDEDDRVIELLKVLDNENRTQKNEAVAKLEKKREEEAKALAKKQKKAAAEAARLEEEKKAKVAAKAKSAAAEKAAAEAVRLAEEKKVKAAAAEKAATEAASTAAERKRRTKGVETSRATAEGARKTAVKKTSQSKAKTGAPQKGATKTTTTVSVKKQAAKIMSKVSAKKSVVKKASRTYSSIDDWALLADSTLKRKTVVQLTEYLTEKGVTATDESGKVLKKAELLEAVKSL